MKTLKWIKFKSRLIFASLIMMVCDYIETTLYNWKYISTWVSSNIYYKKYHENMSRHGMGGCNARGFEMHVHH